MELFISEELHNDKDGMQYMVKFNRTSKKAAKHFDTYTAALGRINNKKFDLDKNKWKVDAEGYKILLAADESINPKPRKKPTIASKLIKVEQKDVGNYSNIGRYMKLSPYDYQKKVTKFCLKQDNALIVAPCGAGKTAMILAIYDEAVHSGKISGPGVIVVKASLKIQWFHEVSKFTDYRAKVIDTYKSFPKKDRDEKFEEQFRDADLFIMNYETLRDEKVRTKLHKIKPQIIMADECQYIKSDTTSRAKALCEFNDAKMKFGATATPVQRDPRDLYGIYKFINPELFVKKSTFERLYIRWASRGIVAGVRNEKQLYKKISPYMFVLTKEEVCDQLPGLVVTQRYCNLNKEQQAMTDKLMEELDDLHEKEKKLQGVLTDKEAAENEELRQIEAGILMRQTFAQEIADSELLLAESDSNAAKDYISGGNDNKLDMLMELIEEIVDSGEKVCVFSRFAKMQRIITDRIEKEARKNKLFRFKIAYVRGDISSEQRYTETHDKFSDDDDYKLLLMSDAGAEGISLSKCGYLIEYEPANSYAIQTQRYGRIQRADSTHKTVYVYQLVANGSWDEIAQKIVAKKEHYDDSLVHGNVSEDIS